MDTGTRVYQLTDQVLMQHAAGKVLCLAPSGIGRAYRLHAERPGAELNEIIGGGVVIDPEQHQEPKGDVLVRVDIHGAIEQRAGYADYCGGWTDGHDAIAERMIAALEVGDVVMVFDSPGGAAAGLEEAVRRVLAAKADYDRRVYAFADEMIGSAAYWWAASVADEIYVPRSGMVGSIGARSGHMSVAGHLEKEGVEVTYFTWPGEGKVAFAQEKPLSDVGRQRGQRDVTACGEAFAAAVEAARPGLTQDAIVELDADVLAGDTAVSAGLADGVATLEDVIEHALAVASGEEPEMAIKKNASESDEPTQTRNEGDEPEPDMEGEDPDPDAEDEDPDAEDEDPDADGDEPEPDADAEPDPDAEGDEPDPDAEGDEPDPDAEDDDEPVQTRARARRPRPKARASRSGKSLAELAGLRAGASTLAVKTAVMRMRSTLARVMKELEVETEAELIGAAKAVAQDAKRLARVESKNKQLLKQRRAERRMAAAKKLAAAGLPGFTRGDVFVDVVDEITGKRKGLKLAREYQEMKLETFEAFVARKLKGGGASARRATPFDADKDASRDAASTTNVSAAAIAWAKKQPAVISAAQRSGKDIETYARAHAALFPHRGAADPV